MKLPRAKTVNNILADYCSHIASRGGRTQNITNEVASGLKVYFEQAIGTILLYVLLCWPGLLSSLPHLMRCAAAVPNYYMPI